MKLHEHLAEAFQDQASFHIKAAHEHKNLSKSCEEAGRHDEANAHAALSNHHTSAAEKCLACSKEAMKTVTADLGKADGITSTIPSNVPTEGFGIRAVPRTGQPELGGIDRASIPPQFRHLTEIGDE
jgi:hypothetical protein